MPNIAVNIDPDQLRELVQTNTNKEIADILGVGRATVSRYIKLYGIDRPIIHNYPKGVTRNMGHSKKKFPEALKIEWLGIRGMI